MGDVTGIKWTDHTFNPWEGCQKVGPGCDHCYAETRNARYGGGVAPNWGAGAPRRRTSAANWKTPLKWNRQAEKQGKRHKVFCASLADVFDNAVDPSWRDDLFELIRQTPWLDWQLLTKRIGNVPDMLPADWGNGYPNVWLGITVVNQVEADRDVVKLLMIPARIRFLSMEPLLGRVDLTRLVLRTFAATANALTGMWTWDGGPTRSETPRLDWVICGGESGRDSTMRPIQPVHPEWLRFLRDQCFFAGVAFFFKQWGEWVSVSEVEGDGPHHHFSDGATVRRLGTNATGARLDGVEHLEFPKARAA